MIYKVLKLNILYASHAKCHKLNTFPSGRTPPESSSQRSDYQVGPLQIPIKPEAIKISLKLWQASGVKANVCYITRQTPYGKKSSG